MNQTPRPAPPSGRYDAPYWRYAAEGELRLQRCGGCGQFRYPPGPVCPDCLAEEASWERLSGTGTLLAWTVFHRQYFPWIPAPYLVGAVRTTEGPILIGNLVGIDATWLVHDMPLRAVFESVTPTDTSLPVTAATAVAEAPDQSPDGTWRLCQWTPSPTHPHHEEQA
ncbi:OB-fold domain-containing protein [Streptomyces sp. NPDC005953]|uniref:Zn-ribbon domain-containing OB-fold protein n=1 Tax=Streptomyces sp. NPDC005953 TaxID=3156719 RepID=UPI0033CD40E6